MREGELLYIYIALVFRRLFYTSCMHWVSLLVPLSPYLFYVSFMLLPIEKE